MIGILVWQELHNSQISPCLCRHCAAHLAWHFQSVVHYTRGQILEQPFEYCVTYPFSSLIQGQKFYMTGKELLKNNSERLDYNFIFKPLESTVYYDDGYTYSMAQLELRFSRTEKSKNQIFGGYYAGTLTFACLSLVSFFIHPDMVPGRMGMLIMLYLIQVNTYGSLDAPPKRGFSSIEVKVKPKVSKT